MATPLQTTEPVQRSVPPAPVPETEATADALLQLTEQLHHRLEIDALLQDFHARLAQVLELDGLGYEDSGRELRCDIGRKARHRCTYNLRLEDESLGNLVLMRRRKFSDEETRQLENHICCLLYPLRNALRYRDAVALARKDPLTGIGNRAAFDESLAAEIDYARRHDLPLTLVIIDIDRFKSVNDQFGHLAGDEALRAVVHATQRCIRRSDLVFRYGGEEFALLLRNTDNSGACMLAERIRRRIEHQACKVDKADIRLTVSAGVATLIPADSAQSLFERADEALYLAKEKGRNRVVCASSEKDIVMRDLSGDH